MMGVRYLLGLGLTSIVVGGASLMLGVWTYIPAPPSSAEQSARPRRMATQVTPAIDGLAERIVDRYGDVLRIKMKAVQKEVVAKASDDSLAGVRFAGVVEEGGEKFAVFIVETGNTQRVLSVRRGEEVVAAWKVEHIEKTSAVVEKDGEVRRFALFE